MIRISFPLKNLIGAKSIEIISLFKNMNRIQIKRGLSIYWFEMLPGTTLVFHVFFIINTKILTGGETRGGWREEDINYINSFA